MGKEREGSVLDQATLFVLSVEERDFQRLFKDKLQADKAARTCGCPQCKKHAEKLDRIIKEESIRLNNQLFHPDHEEDYLADHAIKKLYERNR